MHLMARTIETKKHIPWTEHGKLGYSRMNYQVHVIALISV